MRTIVFAVMASLSGPGLAAAGIVATDDPGSDCVAATIATARTPGNRRYDQAYCAVNQDPAAYRTCLDNASANPSIVFFTDRCGEAGDGAYVSFNGQTHRVWRKPGAPPHAVRYAGRYAGKPADDVQVRVVPGKLIERFEEDGELLGITHGVDVFITHAGETVKIAGVYDDRR